MALCHTVRPPFWCCSSLRHHTDVYHNKEMQVKCPIDHCSVAYCFVGMYSVQRSVKGMQILWSNTQTGPSRAGKQKQEQISPNHISPFSQSLYTTLLCSLTRWRLDAMQLVSCTSWGKTCSSAELWNAHIIYGIDGLWFKGKIWGAVWEYIRHILYVI